MKFTINADCTPEEARAFFGLPDLKPMQEAMMQDVQDRMKKNMNAMDPETLMRMWMPGGMQAFGDLQKMLWDQMTGMMPGNEAQESRSKKRTG